MIDGTLIPDEWRARLAEKDAEIAELRAALAKLEVVKEITVKTNDLLDHELYKSTIAAKVSEIGAFVSDYRVAATRLMELIGKIVDYDVATLLLARGGDRRFSVYVNGRIGRDVLDGFEDQIVDAYAGEAGTQVKRESFSETVLHGEVLFVDGGSHIQSFCAAPLCAGGEVFAVAAIGRRSSGGFPRGGKEGFELIAEQAGILADDAARHEALRRSHEKVEALHYTARALEACDTEGIVHRVTFKAVRDVLSPAAGFLATVAGDRLAVAQASIGFSPAVGDEMELASSGIVGEAVRTGKTILGGGALDGAGLEQGPRGSEAEMASPLGEFGVVKIVSREFLGFDDEDVKLLELLLGHSAQAIQRIHMTKELTERATRDPLTGAYNRRYFGEMVQMEAERARRKGRSISFLMFDVNKFKAINDTRGHQMGDRVLQEVVVLLMKETRASDIVVRYGGDEFLVVLAEGEGTEEMGQRIADAFAAWGGETCPLGFPVSVAIGEAVWDPSGTESIEGVLSEADELMYEDKKRTAARRESEPRVADGGRDTPQ
ncbi:sensor domain-containing diguanylate cyclase [bacterium]|nr:sensor domain-containing diguanylate cyclase [bacterium]